MPTLPPRELATVANPNPDRWYTVEIDTAEFTCLCPVTGQPDFATVRISYVPGPLLVELKSLKLYLWSYRSEGAFHEAVTNQILDDLIAACRPRRMTVTADFNVRGGLHTVVTVTYEED